MLPFGLKEYRKEFMKVDGEQFGILANEILDREARNKVIPKTRVPYAKPTEIYLLKLCKWIVRHGLHKRKCRYYLQFDR